MRYRIEKLENFGYVVVDRKTDDCVGHLFATREEAVAFAIQYMRKQERGFSLLESMIVLALMAFASIGFVNMLNNTLKVNKQLTIKLNNATQAATNALSNPANKDKRVLFPVLNECKALVGNWYAKRTDSRVLSIYKSNSCSINYVGTLTALSNPTYDDTETDTFWNVSGEANTLRVFIMKENL